MDNEFQKLGISDALVKGLAKQGILHPTQVQETVIPKILSGKDVIARSQTGSGKTLAYVLPAFSAVDLTLRSTQVIILTPTHELAAQVARQVELLAKNAEVPVHCALIIGSASMTRQIDKLKKKPQIVVGSAGRILDLIQKRKIAAHTVKTIVMDEGDRLLDDKNIDSIRAVIKTTLRDRQLVVLSASISPETRERASLLMKEDKEDISITEDGLLPESISHYYIVAELREKFIVLRKILAGEKPKKAIVFLNNPENIEVTVEKLNYHGIAAAGIYGNAYKTERKNAMEDFRTGRAAVLVASDLGARGIDVLGVTHIINLDIPEEPTFYLHRAGRTGRQGEAGVAISLVTPHERKWIHKYQKTWGITFQEKEMAFGKLTNVTQPVKTAKKTGSQQQKGSSSFFAKKSSQGAKNKRHDKKGLGKQKMQKNIKK